MFSRCVYWFFIIIFIFVNPFIQHGLSKQFDLTWQVSTNPPCDLTWRVRTNPPFDLTWRVNINPLCDLTWRVRTNPHCDLTWRVRTIPPFIGSNCPKKKGLTVLHHIQVILIHKAMPNLILIWFTQNRGILSIGNLLLC